MATNDIFGRLPLNFGGAFSADAAVVTFGLGPGVQGGVGLLTQNLQFSYMQQISRIYEIGTRNVYYVAGRSQGQGSIARVLGPRPISLAFYATYGNPCNAGNNTLVFSCNTGCEVPNDLGNNTVNFSLNGVVTPSVSMSIQAEQMMFNEQLSLLFIAMIVGPTPPTS